MAWELRNSGVLTQEDRERPGISFLSVLLPFAYIVALQVIALRSFWLQSFRAGAARGWDASAHYAAALIYDRSIFPDTFGWTSSYFFGMPFPNYYAPLLFWSVAALAHLGVPFDTAFKLVALVPTVLTIPLLWLLALKLFGRSVAFWTALYGLCQMVIPQLSGGLMWPSGLDYDSTFIVGLYAQALGFVLLICWYLLYESDQWSASRFVFSTLLLALSVLSNYLSSAIASLFVFSSVTLDLISIYRHKSNRNGLSDLRVDENRQRIVLYKISSPIWAVLLTAFWSTPMLATYRFLVSRPFKTAFFTPPTVFVQVVAIGAGMAAFRRTTKIGRPLILVCILLFVLTLSSNEVPNWLPFQANRFYSTLSFLLTILVGLAISDALAFTRKLLKNHGSKRISGLWHGLKAKARIRTLGMVVAITLAFLLGRSRAVEFVERAWTCAGFYPADPFAPPASAYVRPDPVSSSSNLAPERLSDYKGDFGSLEGLESLKGVLQFAKIHRDGAYLVCLPNDYKFDVPSLDAKAISAYLGAQGNESAYTAYREASPSSVFLFPQTDALSPTAEVTPRFGLSSILAEDLDFFEQSLSLHVARLGWLGIHYVVVYDESVKERFAAAQAVGERQDFGHWSVLTLRNAPKPFAEALRYRPALYVGDFTLKMRRSDEHNFLRLAEEQFLDNWFDVLLVRSPVVEVNRLTKGMLDQFGAVIVETYDFDHFDQNHLFEAYDVLRNFARSRPLILFRRDEYLFNRIRTNINEFPHAVILDVEERESGIPLESVYGPTNRFRQTATRREWQEIRKILDQNKIAVSASASQPEIQVQRSVKAVTVTVPANFEPGTLPILLRMSYHPRWKVSRGGQDYPSTPFFTVLFVLGNERLCFVRSALDKAAVILSAVSALALASLLTAGLQSRVFARQLGNKS